MRLITCNACQSQFDVASMAPGSSFVCGKCRNVLEVPEAGPVVQPISPSQSMRAAAPPPTVSMTPDQVRKALQASREVQASRPAPPTERKLPKAMQQRAQQSAQQSSQRASGSTGTPAAKKPAAAKPAAAKPAAARPAAARPASGPAAAKPAAKPAASRAAASKPAAKKPAAASRSSGGRSARPARSSGSDQKKSQTPLFAGIGVGVLAIAGIAFFLMKGSDEGGQDTGTGTTPEVGADATSGASTAMTSTGTGTDATSGTTDPAPAPGDEIGQFLALTPQQQEDEIGKRVAGAQSDLAALKSLFDHFSQERLAASPAAKRAREMAAGAALRLDASSAWANEASGRKNLRDFLKACKDECPKAFEFADENENAVQNKLEEITDAAPWVDAKDFREFEKIVIAIRAREESLAGDTRLVQVETQKDWIRKNPLFKDLNIVTRYEEPYVLFQQWTAHDEGMERYDEQRAAKADALAKRDGIIFRELNTHFRNLFGERFTLPTLGEKGRLLRVLILWDRETFDEWHRKQDSGISGLVRAYYSPGERHIVHYVGTEALREQDYFKVEGDRMQKQSDQVTFHEGTHQLMHEYGAIFQGAPLPSDPEAVVMVPPRRSMWFDEGLAEFMGSVEIDAKDAEKLEGTFYHNRILLERIGFARSMRTNFEGKKWPLSKMLLPNHNGEMVSQGAEIIKGRGDLAANLFYAQAWCFVHFAWYYDDGKYRSKLLDYMERVLKNEHGPDAFAKAFGLPSAEDFGPVEAEYDWYWNEVLRRVPGPKGNAGLAPNTDPPTGRYDPDDSGDGGDYDE